MILADYLKISKKTHLIFDFDETILKLILPWENAVEGIRDKLIRLNEKIYKDYKKEKISLSSLQNQYILNFGEKILGDLIKNELKFEKKYLKGTILNQELIDFIKKSSGYKMLIWSSNTKPTIKNLLIQHRIFDKFKKIVTREDVKLLKPEIDGFNLLYDIKVPKGKYLFIGDSKFDRMAAEKAGIDFYSVDFFHVERKYW